MDADAKRVKAAIKTLGRKHVTHLREAFGDHHAVYWFTWQRNKLGGRSPLQAIEAGEVDKVKEIIEFSYTNLPELTEEDRKQQVAELQEVDEEEE
jgi:hypothetical protein